MRKRSQTFFVVSWLLFILLCTLLQNLPLEAASLAPAGTNAVSLTPSEIVARAREWVTAKVPYTQDASAQYRFQNYRTDCSGLVTMAWGIPATPPNYGLSTDTLSSVADSLGKALDSSGQPIMATMLKLQPGDILLNQGSDAHAILFVGWIDISKKQVVDRPVPYKNGRYYYDGIEENGAIEKKADGTYVGYAIEHTPNYPVDAQQFDFHQPWPFPYDPGYDPGGYYVWHFDPVKAAMFGYTGGGTPTTTTIKPSGEWMPPSPKNGDIIADNTLHLAATAYPTHKGDPAIATVHFTLEVHGVWTIVCSPNNPSRSGSVYICDVDLKQFKFPIGQMQQLQVSFDVIDKEENVNLAPNGVHTISYVPRGNMTGFSQFIGLWKYYGTVMIINANGTATYEGRTHVFCSDDPRPPCDGGDLGLDGLNTTLLFSRVDGNTAFGVIIGGTGDRDIHGNILPVGSAINVTLVSKGTLQISEGNGPFLSCVDYPNSIECISNT